MYLQQMHNEIMCWSTDQNVTTNSYEPHHELRLIAVAHHSVFNVSGRILKLPWMRLDYVCTQQKLPYIHFQTLSFQKSAHYSAMK